MTHTFSRRDLFVAPNGNDRWSGTLAEPDRDGTDGPFATIDRARERVRARKEAGELDGPVTVWLRGGRYPLAQPVIFGPEDSAPVTYAAFPGEQPILSGGKRIEGWTVEERDGRTVWVVDLPEVAAGKVYYKQLWVNGARRLRAHYPKVTGERPEWLWIEDVPGFTFQAALFEGTDSFIVRPGDIREWRNLDDVEVVVLHYWIEERMPIAAFDPETRRVTSRLHSIFSLKDDFTPRWAKYYVDNVFEALSVPGEWYLDRPTGRLHYLPLPGETPDAVEAFVPVTSHLLELTGDPDANRFVEFLRFEGLTFEHAEWERVTDGGDPNRAHRRGVAFAAAAQSAYNLPGAVRFTGARYCALEDCTVRHVGGYGVQIGDACRGVRLVGNHLHDLGAGGFSINGAAADEPRERRTGNLMVTDNHIHDGGRVFHSGCGILARHVFGCSLSHNHIHDLYYSAVSCGWVWGYRENVARDNRIEKNRIHDLGKGWLSDMGGIYTLGVQPGTVLRGNLIHDIRAHNYGGWAIYPDEGSSHLLIENNVCYNAGHNPFNQHYGRENLVRNNVFAFGGGSQLNLGRREAHVSFTLQQNIVVTRDQPIYSPGYGNDYSEGAIRSDYNLFWSVTGAPLAFGRGRDRTVDLEGWRTLGYDRHSVVADPLFRDVENYDFTLSDDSPALALGFSPIDLSDVGPRPKEKRGGAAQGN